nr:immunoglobulin light chain junction region [Macaca mulatta]MOV80313.1 immunoglobulin light chain junction region [Macaca mulatta]MOV86444.1 immunoglobulin light chain junction region [Macaca mulatta]
CQHSYGTLTWTF